MTDQPPAEDERTEPPADVLGDGPPLAAETGRSRRRGLVFGAAATVLALVAAGGVVLSVRLAGGGRQPESLAPRSTFAFVKVDLDPAANQKLAIRDFSSKFPDAPKAQAEDIIERLIAEALENDDDVKFDQDIKPWLGRRAAIAGFADSAGKPQVIAIVQSDDDAEAKRSLQRIADREREAGDRPAYAVHKGYVVFAEEQSVADQAVRDAEAAALPENKTFRSDVEELDGDQVVVGWVDVEAAYAAARRENPSLDDLPPEVAKQLKGRLVTGLHFESNYAQVEGFALGTDTSQVTGAKPEVLRGLPASTVAAVSFQGLGKNLDRALGGVTMPEFNDYVAELEGEIGLKLREDVLPLFAKEAVFTLGAVPRGPLPSIGVASQVEDENKARTVGGRLTGLAARFDVPLKSDVKNGTFYLATPQEYVDRLQAEHGLGDTETFRTAMGDLGETVSFAGYVDLGQLLTLAEDQEEYDNIKPLHALGLSVGVREGKAYFQLRLAVR